MAEIKREVERKLHPDELLKSSPYRSTGNKIIAIGSSTGGVDALIKIFSLLKKDRPPIVIAQHIPSGFSNSFAKRLDTVGAISCKEAVNGDVLMPNNAYLAPGNTHLIVERSGDGYIANISDGAKISRHRPSVDILFRSVNNAAGKGALGVILTGMGDDGMIGMKDLFDNGATTIAQNEESCVVFGMPKRAIENGGVVHIMNLQEIAEMINSY